MFQYQCVNLFLNEMEFWTPCTQNDFNLFQSGTSGLSIWGPGSLGVPKKINNLQAHKKERNKKKGFDKHFYAFSGCQPGEEIMGL